MPTSGRRDDMLPDGSEGGGIRGVLLGRRRFMAVLGGGLFGVATKAFAPKTAVAAPTPSLCYGAPGCDTCSGATCTGCYNGPAYSCGGNHCWVVGGPTNSDGSRTYYNCCDWYRSDESICICRGTAYTTGPTQPPPSQPPPSQPTPTPVRPAPTQPAAEVEDGVSGGGYTPPQQTPPPSTPTPRPSTPPPSTPTPRPSTPVPTQPPAEDDGDSVIFPSR